ncbi:ATP-binding protein [Actinacidiphila rubida]|uniref:Anti-sigma regulatory factor (Ser/Thr protein kinase) n=1 Tax=Actinacidiphila rubida TaxID=310780 RepID=A0A1H8R015_9ACTN|nr:ATP-binding protein [Actinacidiphila rubida]SEO59233.1 Anti-sigma regulatory factor (Ser/Thr protein kinase) [Actinacidiphila rubida]
MKDNSVDNSPTVATAGCRFPRHRQSASRARAFVRAFLATVEAGERYRETGELVVSELVANAVEHARTPPDRLIEVMCALHGGVLRVEVHDGDPAPPRPRRADAYDDRGRGLVLVEALSAAWGHGSRVGAVGKCVWAVIALGPASVPVAAPSSTPRGESTPATALDAGRTPTLR